jgi:hypothetical protein
MKKSKYIELVLITAALASCNKPTDDWESGHKVYMRSDTTAPYSRARHFGSPLLWYYAFRPLGMFANGQYQRAGYYSGAIAQRSNIGNNSFKGAVARGGFGRGAARVSS